MRENIQRLISISLPISTIIALVKLYSNWTAKEMNFKGVI